MPVDVECIANALPEHAAFAIRYLGNSLKLIASDLVTSGGVGALKGGSLGRVVASIADGSLPVGKPAAPKQGGGPAQTRTIEIMSNDPPVGMRFNALLNTTVRGNKKGNDLVVYNVIGMFSARTNNLIALKFVLDQNVGERRPKGLDACPTDTTLVYPGDTKYFPVLSFARDAEGRWSAPDAECIAGAIPKDVAFMVRFLADSFDVIARDLVSTGAVENLESESLRQFMAAVAEGKVLVGHP